MRVSGQETATDLGFGVHVVAFLRPGPQSGSKTETHSHDRSSVEADFCYCSAKSLLSGYLARGFHDNSSYLFGLR